MSRLIPKDTGYFRSFDNTRIYYEVRGEGTPLILHYGIGCLMNHWTHQIRHFSETHRVITYDYRAHHKSELPENRDNISVDALARDVRGLMDHLQIPTAIHFGHSFGVQVLVRAYDLYPSSFSRLVFINGFVKNPLNQMFGNDMASKFFHSLKAGYSLLPETIGFLWRAGVSNPLAIQLSAMLGGFNLQLTSLKDVEIYARGVASMNLEAFITLFESMVNYDGQSVLDRIESPTLIIGGQQDSVTPFSHQEALHKAIRHSQLLMVPYGSHCSQLDMPDLVNLRIRKFLSEFQ